MPFPLRRISYLNMIDSLQSQHKLGMTIGVCIAFLGKLSSIPDLGRVPRQS